jgi:hypothetical protein
MSKEKRRKWIKNGEGTSLLSLLRLMDVNHHEGHSKKREILIRKKRKK